MGTKGGGEVGSNESGASEIAQLGGREEGAEDHRGDEGQPCRDPPPSPSLISTFTSYV